LAERDKQLKESKDRYNETHAQLKKCKEDVTEKQRQLKDNENITAQ